MIGKFISIPIKRRSNISVSSMNLPYNYSSPERIFVSTNNYNNHRFSVQKQKILSFRLPYRDHNFNYTIH